MNTHLNLLLCPLNVENKAHTESFKILQITDTHLFADKHQDLLGVPTYKSFHAVLDSIKKQQLATGESFDLIVCTGDITQDQSLQSYQHFADAIEHFDTPCVWLPGNHDFQDVMVEGLTHANISEAKHVLLGDNWLFILLDSQLSGVPKGALSVEQLQYLDNLLAAHSTRNAMIFVHHNALASGSLWLDQHQLQNSDEFAKVLHKYNNIKAIVCGHIHQQIDSKWHNWPFFATPSTSIQFMPHSETFSLDTQTPGWREFVLLPNGDFETAVKRIEEPVCVVNTAAKGY